MKTIQFTYTKADNTVSERKLAITVAPSKNYAGMDVTDFSPEDLENYLFEREQLHNQYLKKIEETNNVWNANKYRQFEPSRMTNIIEI